MNILNISWIQIIIYLLATVIYTQFYKIVTKKSKKDGALTIILELLTACVMIAFIPLFEIKWSENIWTYVFTLIAIVFYCIKDRLGTTARKHLEASTVNILDQVLNIFMIVWGVLFFKEELMFKKIIGAFLIIASNVMIFYRKGSLKLDKYVIFSILSNLSLSIALSLNVGNSEYFNIAIYEIVTLTVPAVLIFLFERVKINDMKEEIKVGDKKAIVITSIAWAVMIISQLRAYQTGDITTVASFSALSVILNVIAGYLFLKEKDDLAKKIIAAILIIISVFLIKG